MKVKYISLAVLVIICILLSGAPAVNAQVPPSPVAQTYTIHEDLLKCYHNLGKAGEEEAEYKWLLTARPSTALLHYNYAVLLKSQNKYVPAGVQYEKAAQYEGSNVDYVGQCGQMFFYLKNYQKAYQYLGKAMQMPGGDKYNGSFDSCREYLQNIGSELLQIKQPPRPAPKSAPALRAASVPVTMTMTKTLIGSRTAFNQITASILLAACLLCSFVPSAIAQVPRHHRRRFRRLIHNPRRFAQVLSQPGQGG